MRAPTDDELERWRTFVQHQTAHEEALRELRDQPAEAVAAWLKPWLDRVEDRWMAFELIPHLSTDQKKALFDEIVAFASWPHGSWQLFHDVIADMPRDWVLEHVERAAEASLASGEYEEYGTILSLFDRLDAALGRRLAERMTSHREEDVRDLGERHLQILAERQEGS
jgi:hypothetical protein